MTISNLHADKFKMLNPETWRTAIAPPDINTEAERARF
jgi:hypothetical protein